MIVLNRINGAEVVADTVLMALEVANIFGISRCGDAFTIYERCDFYYEATLTRDQLLMLSDELRALAESS